MPENLNQKTINCDRSDMKKMILDLPKQFSIGLKAAKNIKTEKLMGFPENVIICGMGGSGLPADIMATLRPIDVFAHKSYGLPPQAVNKSLIICISYSGNTEETLDSFNEAIKRNLAIISITTGGKLAELSKKHNIPVAIIPPPYIPPRLGLGLQFAALVQVLTNQGLIGKDLSKELQKLSVNLKSVKYEPKAKQLAKKIYQKIPIVYTTKIFREVSSIWKISINENAKIMAVSNYFPELNHNETVGWLKINERQVSNSELLVIILKDPGDHPRILKQMEITKSLIEKEGVEVLDVNFEGKTMLEKIFSGIILGFWTSYHLALEYGIDPTPVEIIDEFKKRLKEN